MSSSSTLMFVFISYMVVFNYTFCFWKKPQKSLENYVIDVFFTNSLTIIRCTPYERHILRGITIESIGHIKCSNRDLFLPDNHVENITLLEWAFTTVKCDKSNKTIKEHRTYLNIKHKAKNAFKKNPLGLVLVGSTGPSQLYWDTNNLRMHFAHPKHPLPTIDSNNSNESFISDVYAFQHRPILCRERKLSTKHLCSKANHTDNTSYVCYYRIGVPDPPTIAQMEKELRTMPRDIELLTDSEVNLFIDKSPPLKSSILPYVIVIVFVILVIACIIIVCICCQSQQNEDVASVARVSSNASNVSNIS